MFFLYKLKSSIWTIIKNKKKANNSLTVFHNILKKQNKISYQIMTTFVSNNDPRWCEHPARTDKDQSTS